ncbi:alpha/beta hydrolase [Methylocella sp.]|uniref:alpha/beta hydrolase n=1 Tax=Methylocella sp. TaxID=1978226 RepID=UPI0037850ABA
MAGAGETARRLACRRLAARPGVEAAGVVFLGGFRSNMRGEKASFLAAKALETGRAFLRFDYSGHGDSGGRFEDGTIGRWLDESLALIRGLTEGPQILVGSSMGGWLALLAARALAGAGEADRLAGLVLAAPAVDMTEALICERMSAAQRRELAETGVFLRPSRYGDGPYPVGAGFLEEGRRHLLFGATVRSHCPVHIVQGMQDEDAPYRHALKLVEHMPADPVTLTLARDGGHRLSRPQDLALIWAAVEGIEALESRQIPSSPV